ncbi:hypothetical protein R1sor_024940 [Riccia sorocarpa]|uniref:Methenyltetrahydrofolate cyclohydrolase n=1 Tax=Riccia sorocarpa TaxID=122646 RepID=A0ABD3G9X0_9MARC
MAASALAAALLASPPCTLALVRARFSKSTLIDRRISRGYVGLGSAGLLRGGWRELDEKLKRFSVGDNNRRNCHHGGSVLHVSANAARARSEEEQFVRPPLVVVPSAEITAEVIDGKRIAEDVRREIAQEVMIMKETRGQVPGLAVVLVGNRVDSATYTSGAKRKPAQMLDSLRMLPLPEHMNEEKVIGAISAEKDVDGFHPLNVGRLVLQGRTPLFVSCTPRGCIELLLRSGVEIAGKHAVVIGRSNVVGMPAAILLQAYNATVTVVHSLTPNPAEITKTADIIIVAVGVAQLVRGDWIKPGAVVVDVGMNSLPDSTKKKGYRLVGDVCYPEAAKVASKITPVPGGVGPMTIAMLLQNTLDSAKRTLKS